MLPLLVVRKSLPVRDLKPQRAAAHVRQPHDYCERPARVSMFEATNAMPSQCGQWGVDLLRVRYGRKSLRLVLEGDMRSFDLH